MKKKVLVTGACGFIGSTLARRLCGENHTVIGIDNLSRRGVDINLADLNAFENFRLHKIDVADPAALETVFREDGPFDAVFHLSGQTAVTSSYADPLTDFRSNAMASFYLLDCIRRFSSDAYCVYASTNKVYGNVQFDRPVGSKQPLNPYTPYGVSKGVGDLYFSEFGNPEIGLDTCVFRQSCIYGENQLGVEDQGWLAWFAAANLFGRPVTVFGDGKQIRDMLYVTDLVDLYLRAWNARLTGAYPVGGGVERSIDLNTALEKIEAVTGENFSQISRQPTRSGDQRYFVADNNWTEDVGMDWAPSVNIDDGMTRMINWMKEHQDYLGELFAES